MYKVRRVDHSSRTTTTGKDEYGRVNGHIPPLVLGPHVYELFISEATYLVHIARLPDGVELMWEGEKGNQFAQRHYIILGLADVYTVGLTYRHLLFRHTQTNRSTSEAIYSVDSPSGDMIFPSGCGIYCYFPWYASVRRRRRQTLSSAWMEKNPTTPMPPIEYFGKDEWSREVTDIFITYVRELFYWGYCHFYGWGKPGKAIREEGDEAAKEFLVDVCKVKRRDLWRHGY